MLNFAAAARRRGALAPPAAAISVNVGTAVVGVNASVNVPVVVPRTNYSGEVVLSATNLPPNTSASFNPSTLGPGVSNSVLTLTTTASATTSVTNVNVVATPARLSTVTAICALTITNATGLFATAIGRRYVGTSGDVLVSGAIPLGPTALLRSDIPNVALDVGGVERNVYLEALGKDYPGGYVRSLLIQRHENMLDTDVISATLRVLPTGTPLSRLTKETCPAVPDAMWSSGTAEQLCLAKGVFHVVRPYSTWDRSHVPTANHIDSYAADQSFFAMSNAPRGHATYEPAWHAFGFYAATANTTYLRNGLIQAQAHALQALPLLAQLDPDWNYQCEGMAAAYLLTGSEVVLQYIRHHASQAAYRYSSTAVGGLGEDPSIKTRSERTRYRCLRMLMAGDRVGLTTLEASTTGFTWNCQTSLAYVAAGCIAAQWPSGWWAFTENSPVDIKWFMGGEYGSTLALYHDWHDNSLGLVAKIGAFLNLAWPYYRRSGTDKGFPYTTPQIQINPPGSSYPNQWWGDGDPSPTNAKTWSTNFWVFLATWYAAHVGGAEAVTWNANARTMIDDMHDGYVRNFLRAGEGTTFDQNYWYFPQSIAALSGVTY